MQLGPQDFQVILLIFMLYLGQLLEGLQQLRFLLTSVRTGHAQ